jgi:hypothetical protein
LAELEHPRTTGPTMSSSLVSGAGMSTTGRDGISSMIPTSMSTLGSGGATSQHGGIASSHYNTTNYSSGINSLGLITSSTSSYALADSAYCAVGAGGTMSSSGGGVGSAAAAAAALGLTGSNVSPLPIRANLASTMPPLCQVLDFRKGERKMMKKKNR